MKSSITGRRAAVDAGKKIVILATDRHKTGQPLRALTEDAMHLMEESENHPFVRFATAEDAARWMEENRLRLRSKDFVYTITVL